MTNIYLIRHAEADGNLYRRAQGQFDANVTQLGRRQIAALAERFRDIPIDGLWSSDLNRTLSTASAILKYHPDLTLHPEPALREVCMGVWEDRPWGELRREWPEQMAYFTHEPEKWRVPGGEDYTAVPQRVEKILLRLADAYPGRTLAVVSHGFAIRSLLCRLLGQPFSALPYGDNTAVSLLTAEDGRLAVQWYNDASHLTPELSTFAHQNFGAGAGKQKEDAWFAPMDLKKESALYTHCYEETWRASHGGVAGFTPSVYVQAARHHAKNDPETLMKMFFNDTFAGVIELDPDRGAVDGAGWISLLYVEPSFRNRRFGGQLLGHAASYFRRKGRTALRLHVSQTNAAAIGFYEHMGFHRTGEASGVGGPLYEMELDISQRPWSLP